METGLAVLSGSICMRRVLCKKKNLYDVNVQKQQGERGSRRRRTDRKEVRGGRERQGGELKEQSVVSGRKRTIVCINKQ